MSEPLCACGETVQAGEDYCRICLDVPYSAAEIQESYWDARDEGFGFHEWRKSMGLTMLQLRALGLPFPILRKNDRYIPVAKRR